MTDYIWTDAAVSYPDWQGTLQLDERKTGTQLHELVGLDPDAWMIVGLDIGGGEGRHDLHVLAVEARSAPNGGNVFARIAGANGGEIPVRDFLIHNVDPYVVLKAMTHVLELRMRVRSAVGTVIRVTSVGGVPEHN
jgi:hypothetical protein